MEHRAFANRMRRTPLSMAAQLLWYKLMDLANSLRWPEHFALDNSRLAVGSDSQKSSATKSEEGNYVTRECLLNYHIGPAEQVVIQSQSLNGRFIVAKGKHTGTPKGNWKTTIEMKPA